MGGGGGGGGGGDLAGNPRSNFPDTAEWVPVLHTDYNGETSVTITLPDNLTSWRLTAKAVTADTQVGETYTNITTSQEIVVRPILPPIPHCWRSGQPFHPGSQLHRRHARDHGPINH